MDYSGRSNAAAEKKQRYLSRTALFCDLEPGALEEVASRVTLRSYGSGKTLYMPLQKSGRLFLLFEGSVHLYRLSRGGKKLVFAALGPGSTFGDRTLLGACERKMFAQAFTSCVVGLIEPVEIGRIMTEHPQVAIRFLELLGLRLMQLESTMAEMSFQPLSARLARLLLRAADENGSKDEVLGYRHRDFADLLGTYRETITQVLGEFKAQGLVTIGPRRVTVLDRHGLEHRANR